MLVVLPSNNISFESNVVKPLTANPAYTSHFAVSLINSAWLVCAIKHLYFVEPTLTMSSLTYALFVFQKLLYLFSPNCCTLPNISPSSAKDNPGGNLPSSFIYLTFAPWTLVVAFILNVLVRLALIVPNALGLIQLSVLSILPNNLTVNVLSFGEEFVSSLPGIVTVVVNVSSTFKRASNAFVKIKTSNK